MLFNKTIKEIFQFFLCNKDLLRIITSMKDEVGDITSMLGTLTQELQLMHQNNDAQYALICQLNCNTEKLLKENQELRIGTR